MSSLRDLYAFLGTYTGCAIVVVAVTASYRPDPTPLAVCVLVTSVPPMITQAIWRCNGHPTLMAATALLGCCVVIALYSMSEPDRCGRPCITTAACLELTGIGCMAWHVFHAVLEATKPKMFLWRDEDDVDGPPPLVDAPLGDLDAPLVLAQ